MATTAKILLVEDDPAQANLFDSVLKLKGYDVETVYDAEDAATRMSESTFDLVLVDWDLPGTMGDTFICSVKAQYPTVKTVLYSNHANVEQVAHSCGADAWALKSDGIIRLREVVASTLQVA